MQVVSGAAADLSRTFESLRGARIAGSIGGMGSRLGSDRLERFGRVGLSTSAIEVIERAGLLSRADIVRLDLAERRETEFRATAWDLLRDQLDNAGLQPERFTARNDAWEAVARSVARLGLDGTPDDGYWRVAARVGSGAARAARYAACALVAPERVDPEVTAMLLAPWRALAATESR